MGGNLSHLLLLPEYLMNCNGRTKSITRPKGVTSLTGVYLEEQGTVIHSFGLPT